MKVIIDISEKDFKWINTHLYTTDFHTTKRLYESVRNGTPLDDVKAEIVALSKTYPFINHIDTYVKEDDVLQILDNIGKAESEALKMAISAFQKGGE